MFRLFFLVGLRGVLGRTATSLGTLSLTLFLPLLILLGAEDFFHAGIHLFFGGLVAFPLLAVGAQRFDFRLLLGGEVQLVHGWTSGFLVGLGFVTRTIATIGKR